MSFLAFQTTGFLPEAQLSAESPETIDPLFKFHETIAKVGLLTLILLISMAQRIFKHLVILIAK